MRKEQTNAQWQLELAKKTERRPAMPRPVIMQHKKIYDRKKQKAYLRSYEY